MAGGSKSSTSQTTLNQDNRMAVQDGIALSGSSGNVLNISSVDADLVNAALDSVDLATMSSTASMSALLSSAEKLWESGERMQEGVRDAYASAAGAVASAYSAAGQDKAGTVDQRTIVMIVAAVAVVALVAVWGKK